MSYVLKAALSFSLQGHNQIAHKLYGKTLAEMNEGKEETFEVAATFYYTAMYVGGRGKVKLAMEYFNSCKTYLRKSESIFRFVLEPILDGQMILFGNLGSLTTGLHQVQKSQKMEPQQSKTIISGWNQSISDLITQWNAQMPSSERPLKELNISFFRGGVYLQSERERTNIINLDLLPVAAQITELTRSILFPLVTPLTVTAVVEACYVQTTYLLSKKDVRVFEDVKQNSLALRVIAARSELVEIMHGPFLEELARFIDQYDAIESLEFKLLKYSSQVTGQKDAC